MDAKRLVARPPMSHLPGGGVLRAEHFQIAYVTNDVARACDVFRERYGVKAFGPLDADLPAGGRMHVELAWIGGTMIELIEASGPGSAFYNDRLPAGEFAIRHHHLGYFVHDLPAWEALRREVEAQGGKIAFEGRTEGFLRFFYLEAPELGHYLEYFLLDPGGVAFFESVPAS